MMDWRRPKVKLGDSNVSEWTVRGLGRRRGDSDRRAGYVERLTAGGAAREDEAKGKTAGEKEGVTKGDTGARG